MSMLVRYEEVYHQLVERFRLAEAFEKARSIESFDVWEFFSQRVVEFSEKEENRGIFIDVFVRYYLKEQRVLDLQQLLFVLERWHLKRNLPQRCGNFSTVALQMAFLCCSALRESLAAAFSQVSEVEWRKITPKQEAVLKSLWRILFLNCFSPLQLLEADDAVRQERAEKSLVLCKRGSGYLGFMLASMYAPYAAGKLSIQVYRIWESSQIPKWCKEILLLWLVNVPYYNSGEEQQKKVMKYLPEICQVTVEHPQKMSRALLKTLAEEMMGALWKIAYTGGNHAETISFFGDFIQFFSRQLFPEVRQAEPMLKVTNKRDKIRVGYVSRMFSEQAVSYYMVNRLLHHDKQRFEIYTFAIGAYSNPMADRVRQSSTRFFPVAMPRDFADVGVLAQQIQSSDLDILIYPDIGMDIITYFLAGLQLAPIQCALVGHGATTGLPTMQYYISGDFEPSLAQLHYREKLIRLPNLGAAQFPPVQPIRILNRQYFQLPEDKVIFVSCANGLKHPKDRDELFIRILQQAPNAVIALKPFSSFNNVDYSLTKRLKETAEKAGVGERLLVLNPLQESSDLLNLLSLCDVQLDTYPYGGWTTNMEAVYAGLPIVTQEGRMARTRWGAGILRAMGIREGIARDEGEYVAWAVRYAQDEKLRQRVRKQVQDRACEVLFNGEKAQKAYEEILITIYNSL